MKRSKEKRIELSEKAEEKRSYHNHGKTVWKNSKGRLRFQKSDFDDEVSASLSISK